MAGRVWPLVPRHPRLVSPVVGCQSRPLKGGSNFGVHGPPRTAAMAAEGVQRFGAARGPSGHCVRFFARPLRVQRRRSRARVAECRAASRPRHRCSWSRTPEGARICLSWSCGKRRRRTRGIAMWLRLGPHIVHQRAHPPCAVSATATWWQTVTEAGSFQAVFLEQGRWTIAGSSRACRRMKGRWTATVDHYGSLVATNRVETS